jgi:2,3-bisphosphoglycerate-independent phosphoglycerate mutase
MEGKRPVALIIMDGWGNREMAEGNAVVLANTPNYDRWNRDGERSILDASGLAVGLPEGQMGNSEVGHLNLGAGRIVYQDLTRINLAIADKSFFSNPVLLHAFADAKTSGGKVHLIGLFSVGGVHSHLNHLYALIDMANKVGLHPILHLITDGRDTPPESGLPKVEELEKYIKDGKATIASVNGRYYAMDRDRRWQRTVLAYNAIVNHQSAEGGPVASAAAALRAAYAAGVTDEFVLPVAIDAGGHPVTVDSGDTLIFYNFRSDRMRQIVQSFVDPSFDGFACKPLTGLQVINMTRYDETFPCPVVFDDVNLTLPLAEVLSNANCRQFHAAETEKYPHVTYFFNGGREEPFPGEERHLAPSPKVATYDLQPEMSAYPLTEALLKRLAEADDDFILVNYANPDMVGHTGVLSAAIKAVETVDECVGKLVAAINAKGGVAVVTADHGNCERMVDLITGEPHTYHTTQPVNLFVLGDGYYNLRPRGILADVAPTILDLMGVAKPEQMTGLSLVAGYKA